MIVGQRVQMLRPADTDVPAGTYGLVIALEPPAGRALIEWDTGARSVVPGTRDQLLVCKGGPVPPQR